MADGRKRQVEEADRQLKEARQLLEAQNRRLTTITEPVITIFVLLCGVRSGGLPKSDAANSTPITTAAAVDG